MKLMINIKKIIFAKKICNLLTAQSHVLMMSTILLLTIFLPSHLIAKEVDFYTVQTGSFSTDKIATNQFNSLVKGLTGKDLDHLRVEKIGDIYAVRIGKFINYAEAKKLLQARATQLEGAIVLKALYKKERIVKQYVKESVAKGGTKTVEPIASDKVIPLDKTPITQPKITLNAADVSSNKDAPYNEEETKDKIVISQPSPEKKPAKKTKKQSHIKGRVYLSDYYSNDSNSYDFHVLSSRMKVYMRENDDNRYYFKLDARARKKVSDNDVHNDIPEYKFYEAWLGYKFPGEKITLIAGRQHIYEMYNTSVDGINTQYRFSDALGLGIFGGLTPDKYDYSFNAKFKTIGIYSFMDRVKYQLRFGYERLYYDGNTDREYFSFKLFSTPTEKTRVNVLSSASVNQLTNNIDIDNLSATLIHKYSKNLRFNLFFNYYSVIRYFESSKKFFTQNGGSDSYYIDPNSQSRIGLRVNYRIMKKLTLYTSMAYQKREIDDENATRFTGGFRKYDLYGFDLSGRYTRINNFTSKSNEFNVEVSRFLFDKVDVSVYASHEQEELDIENGFTAGLLTYGASVYWTINRHYFASMFIERYDEDDYDNTSIFTQAGYRF